MTTESNAGIEDINPGLFLLIDCLNSLIDLAGNRLRMIKDCKSNFLFAYGALQQYFSVEFINQHLKVSNQRISRLKVDGNCTRSTLKNCFRIYPTQLSPLEQMEIKALLEDDKYQSLPRNYIWADAQRNGLYISLGTFYKYAQRFLGKAAMESSYTVYKAEQIRATRPFQILHMDSTRCRCENGERVYVHFIIDNYSRKVLGAVVSYSSKSPVVAQNLKRIIQEYDLYNKRFSIYCDDGPENQGEVVELLKRESIRATKVVANFKTDKSNNMIEAWNKKFKHIVLRRFKSKSYEHLKELVPKMLHYFNNLYQPVLGTLSPNETISGITKKRLRLEQKIASAKKKRMQINRQILCYINNAAKDCSKPPEENY